MTYRTIALRIAAALAVATGLSFAPEASAQTLSMTVRHPGQSTRLPTGRIMFPLSAFGITVANTSATTAATNVRVDVTLPAGAAVDHVTGCLPVAAPALLPCLVDPTAATPGTIGASATAPTVNVHIAYTAPTTCPTATDYFGAVTFTATPAAGTGATATSQPPLRLPFADVQVEMTGPASISIDGGVYTFPYTITNNGPCAVSTGLLAVVLDDSVASGFDLTAMTGLCAGAEDMFYASCSGDNDLFCYDDSMCTVNGTSFGSCRPRIITSDWTPRDGSNYDYAYCAVPDLAAGGTVSGSKTYTMPKLTDDITSSNQGTGLQLLDIGGLLTGCPSGTGCRPGFTDPVAGNNVSDVTYVVTRSSSGCSTAGGAGSAFMLAGVGVAFLLLRRRRIA